MRLCRADVNLLVLEPVAVRAGRATTDLRAALDAGVASVREVGGLRYLARAIEEASWTAKVIRIFASGRVMSELDHPIHQRFTPAQMRAIVEVAGMADRVVAAHRHGEPGILAALEAGVRTIEHGTYLDEEAAAAMRETGAPRSGQLAAGYDAAIIIDADPLTDIAVPAKPGTIAGCAGPGGGSKAVPAVAPPPVEHGLY